MKPRTGRAGKPALETGVGIKKRFALIVAFLVFAGPGSVHAFDLRPFSTRNQSPFIQIYGLPFPGDASLTPPGAGDFMLAFDLASNCVVDSAAREKLIIDGETYRTTVAGRYGIARDLEAGVEIPYIVQGGGFLDAFIENYHDAFGFSQGDRKQVPRNRLLYRYERDGADRINVDSSGSGVGDIRLTAAYQLYRNSSESPTMLVLRAGLKLPTGDTDQLHGSGSTDLALWLSASKEYSTGFGPWTVFGAAGVLGMTDGKILEDQQRNLVEFGTIGIGWRPLGWFGLKAQINGHTSFFKDSDLVTLNGNSAQLVVGGTFAVSERTTIDIGISEDIVIKTSPDVVFHLAVQSRF
jgi:hypothetical protein